MTSIMEKPMGLSADEITKLMGAARSKNVYGPKLLEFIESDEAAINPVDVWPVEFGSKEASTLYQGFNTAMKKGKLEDTIMVRQSDGNVFILHKERVKLILEAKAAELAEATTDDTDE